MYLSPLARVLRRRDTTIQRSPKLSLRRILLATDELRLRGMLDRSSSYPFDDPRSFAD